MALFEKLFPTKRKLGCRDRESRDRGRSNKLYPEQVRLLLFKECDWKGRKLLFDSSTLEKVPVCKNEKPTIKPGSEAPFVVEVTNGYSYVYKGPAQDASALGEMIFGAVALNYKGVSLKIHIMDEPKRLMCTKLFSVPSGRRISRVDRKAEAEGSKSNILIPSNVPQLRDEVSLSFSFDRGDSGFYGEHSMHSSVSSTCDFFTMFDDWDGNITQDDVYTFHSPPGRKLSVSSNGSWQRRTFRNIATKFDVGSQSSNFLSVPTSSSNMTSCDSQIYSNSSSGTSDSLASGGSSTTVKRNKLGLALLITVAEPDDLDLIRKCMEHSPQLQAIVCRLRLATIAAGGENTFVATLYKATMDAVQWLSDLIYGPRIHPAWLELVTSRQPVKFADKLVCDLCSVLTLGDTKHTKFFVSTLLTHVLTYHLGWVTTVSPYDVLDPQKMTSDEEEATIRPYNALWAQLSDLCGSIGYPPRAAKTVITGTNHTHFMNRLLSVLSYFLRCGEVNRHMYKCNSVVKETRVNSVQKSSASLKRTQTSSKILKDEEIKASDADSSETLVPRELKVKRTTTLANFAGKLSNDDMKSYLEPMTSQVNTGRYLSVSRKADSSSSLNSSDESEAEKERSVVFVLGDDEKLVGLKNKSIGGKSVKKSVKEPLKVEKAEPEVTEEKCDADKCKRDAESPSKCCSQTQKHSKPVKHSGFKFEFDKYPQIVTNYMKSKNLEILDRHYIGKPGNLKLDNFQFDPTLVPPIQEERCDICYKCQLMELTLQTPTNASELEFMNDMPRHSELQYAREMIVKHPDEIDQISPKNFVRRQKENTILVNVTKCPEEVVIKAPVLKKVPKVKKDNLVEVEKVIELSMSELESQPAVRCGFDASLLGAVYERYVPDLVLQGTESPPRVWESELRRDLDLCSYMNKAMDSPIQAVGIVGDVNSWDVRVVCREGASGGMSALVGAMLDALPHMWRAHVPASVCLAFIEEKLREFCILSKTLADLLMSTDFCDISTLTKSLNIDINDVPLLMAVASTHTPQVARRYGISYR